MNYTSGLGRQTAELHNLILSYPYVAEHPDGHTKYVLRYRTSAGTEIAVEKRVGSPLLYFTRALAEGRIDHLDPQWLPASKTGRNHNLNTLKTFVNQSLARLRVPTLDTARYALDTCIKR